MSMDSALAVLASLETNADAWVVDPGTETHTLEFGALEIRVTKARLNDGYEWGLYNQGNIVLQGRWAQTRPEAKAAAIAFAKKWMVEGVTL